MKGGIGKRGDRVVGMGREFGVFGGLSGRDELGGKKAFGW